LREGLAPSAGGAVAADVRIGLGYTAVLLDSGRAGLCYTPREELTPGCSTLADAGRLAGRPAAELLSRLEGTDPLDRTVGLAAANALLGEGPLPAAVEGDVLDAVALTPEDRVGMVGHFAPLESRLRGRVASLTIFEKASRRETGFEPSERAAELLPACTVALLTATILLGEDPEEIMRAAAPCREVVLLGPSTPLYPAAFAAGPVTWLSGVVVADPRAVLRVVGEGGGTREFGPFVRRVNLRVGNGSAGAEGIAVRRVARRAAGEERMSP